MIQVYKIVDFIELKAYSLPKQTAVIKTAVMNINEVQISIISESIIPANVGDYIKIEGANYTINREPEMEKRSDVEYSYDFVFEHPEFTLLDKLYEYKLTGQTSFQLTGRLVDFIRLLIWNVNKDDNPLGIDYGWTHGLVHPTGYRTIHFEHLNCREVLKKLSEEFSCEYFINNKEINFVEKIENVTAFVFEQGKGKGLYSIYQRNVDKGDTVTRIRARGGNKNIPINHADSEGYLKLPEMYIENLSEHNKIVERQVTFDEVYPHFEGEVSSVSETNNSVFICPEIDFDLNEIAVGDNARVNFLTGALMGVSFKFQYKHSEKKITLIEQDDETALPNEEGIRPQIPGNVKKAVNGDAFSFTGVLMPQSYVNKSIVELRQKSNKWLDLYSQIRVKFELNIDYRFMRNKPNLNVGDLVIISIPEKSIQKLIRIVATEKSILSGSISVTASNYLEEDWDKYYKKRIDDLKNEIVEKNEDLKGAIEGVSKIRDNGLWQEGVVYYNNKWNGTDDVWHLGCRWRCFSSSTTAVPSWSSDEWSMVEGRSDVRMEFDSSNGLAFFAGAVDTVITPVVFIGNNNVSADIVQEQWNWKRESGYEASDTVWNAKHKGVRLLHLSTENKDMGLHWSKSSPVRFICTAIYPSSNINAITDYLEI